MLLSALLCLLLGAAAQADYYGSYGQPPVRRCGKQPCYPPNKCEYRGSGVSVCVLPRPPTCAAILCPKGYDCVLQQDRCYSRPCKPEPKCIKKNTNPCGTCEAPNEFCELYPKKGSHPRCRFVVEPRCDNKICRYGKRCREEPLHCIRAPCPIKLVCRRPPGYGYGYYGYSRRQ